jgi:hypothetical protein
VFQIVRLVTQNVYNSLGYDPGKVHWQLLTFDMITEPHAVLFCADGEILGIAVLALLTAVAAALFA